MRKPFQGVLNIIRFNWHYFAVSIATICLLLFASNYYSRYFSTVVNILCSLALATILISLLVSFYVYDLSNFYSLNWLKDAELQAKLEIINISAGFDETSELLQAKFSNSRVRAFDFYDSEKHTEISIRRARKAYPAFPNTQPITTSSIQIKDNSIDKIFLILSAHEIRDSIERTLFFAELKRILKPNGQIILTEHFQDLPNFLAYNIGAFHFHRKEDWLVNVKNAKLEIVNEFKITSFITTFVLKKNGTPS